MRSGSWLGSRGRVNAPNRKGKLQQKGQSPALRERSGLKRERKRKLGIHPVRIGPQVQQQPSRRQQVSALNNKTIDIDARFLQGAPQHQQNKIPRAVRKRIDAHILHLHRGRHDNDEEKIIVGSQDTRTAQLLHQEVRRDEALRTRQ